VKTPSFRFATILGALAVIGCDGASPTQPAAARPSVANIEVLPNVGDLTNPTPQVGVVKVCKLGNVSGTFAVTTASVNGGSTSAPSNPTVEVGACVIVATNADEGKGEDVTITETSAGLQGVTGEGIDVVTGTLFPISFANGGTVFVNRYHGYTLTFTNNVVLPPPPPPTASQGCTPGYWKQPQHFDSWAAPYVPGMTFGSVFADAFPGMTLLQVVSQGGGGLQALGRHTVAALLNSAAGVQNGLSTAQVIDAFNAAYASGDYESQKNIFAALNELGCPLN